MTITKETPTELTESIEQFRRVALPILRSYPGFRKAYVLFDGMSKVITLTVWDSQADMAASEMAVQRLREQFDQSEGPGVPVIERYAVAEEADAT